MLKSFCLVNIFGCCSLGFRTIHSKFHDESASWVFSYKPVRNDRYRFEFQAPKILTGPKIVESEKTIQFSPLHHNSNQKFANILPNFIKVINEQDQILGLIFKAQERGQFLVTRANREVIFSLVQDFEKPEEYKIESFYETFGCLVLKNDASLEAEQVKGKDKQDVTPINADLKNKIQVTFPEKLTAVEKILILSAAVFVQNFENLPEFSCF